MRIFRELLLLLALMALVGGSVFAAFRWWPTRPKGLPISSPSDSLVLTGAEGRLRDLVRREIMADALRDPSVTDSIRRIQDRVTLGDSKLPYPIEVYVIDSPTINAVSLPGGIIVIYTGLIRRMESAEELAGVLAHEMAHVTNHDSMHALERELGVAALLTLAGGRRDALSMRLLRRLINSGFSRQQEQDADKEATRLLAMADIDPSAVAESLRHIRQDDSGDAAVLQYISTHPDIDARIKTAEAVSAAWNGKARPIDMDWKVFRSQFKVLH